MSKCAECNGKGSSFCVELNKVLCRNCVGRLFYPGLKSCDFTLEALDQQHPGVQSLTLLIMNTGVVIVMVTALVNSGIGMEYFKGQNTCPALGVPRTILARADPNLFYYFKASFATYCDIEDSFWRLFMDGWLRGVVGGTDSLLLLFSTLPKALLFKTAISTFLVPVYAVLYAICGIAVSTIIVELEDVGSWMLRLVGHRAPGAGGAAGGGGGGAKWLGRAKTALRFPLTVKKKLTTKSTWPERARMAFLALCLSTSLRLFLHYIGVTAFFSSLLGKENVSVWQLAFEPICYYFAARQCGWLNTKLSKSLWKKGPVSLVPPPTLWRLKPDKDITELVAYTRGRVFRSYNYYKSQARDILHILVDDVVMVVIFFRFFDIIFGLAPMARSFIRSIGLGSMLDRHQEWFMQGTGFGEVDAGARYLSDRLVKFGFREMFVGMSIITQSIEAEAGEVFSHLDTLVYMIEELFLWRLLLPIGLYYLEYKWGALLKRQQAHYKKTWVGADWKDGDYSKVMDVYGTYWNMVSKEEWETPKMREARLKAAAEAAAEAASEPAADPQAAGAGVTQ